jgi:predicted phosphoadenosine phosphosulfate sulfurtransferase
MANKKPKKLNFDSEIVDGRSALEAYRAILDEEWVEPIHRGERVKLSDVLRNEFCPEFGFKKGVLPEHISNVSIHVNGGKQVALSYNGRLDHELEKKYWEEKGYSTRTVKKSMEVVGTDDKVVATYGLNRILIERNRLGHFIKNMR